MGLAYAHLNLRINPFGEVDSATRARLAVVDVELAEGEALQVVGASGRGKTTHLLALWRRLPGAVYHLVPERARDVAIEPPRGMLLIDEAQRLSRAGLRRLLEEAPTLVLGTHDDLSRRSPRPLRTLELAAMPLDRLARIARARIESARRGPGPLPRVPDEVLRRLTRRHGGDVRAIEGRLYDAMQQMAHPQDEWRIGC